MKRIITSFFAICGIIIIICASCAKDYSEGTNVSFKRAFDAWMYLHYPNQEPVGDGIYVISDVPGDGEKVQEDDYVFIEYLYKSLEDSTIVSYSDQKYAKQLGEYEISSYYGPFIFRLTTGECTAGMRNTMYGGGDFDTMRVGGYRKTVLPGWLSGATNVYDTPEGYFNNETGSNYMLELRIVNKTDDIIQWQLDSIKSYLNKIGRHDVDSTSLGVFYFRDKARELARGVKAIDSISLHKDTTIYINYIGRLLNGRVFDTNIKDTAKVYGLYSSSNTYEPAQINCSEDSTSITMTSSETTIINGFAWTIWEMHPYESGTGIFTSNLGYGSTGSGTSIPEYAPLIFEIDIVDEEEE